MKRLIALSLIAVTVVAASTAQASPKSAKHTDQELAIQFQKARYYHAKGYLWAIWHQARRTVYSPSRVIRHKWQGAVKYLTWIKTDALSTIQRLTAPPLLYLDASNAAANYNVVAPLIYRVFGARGGEAVRVSGCETGHKYNTNAANGQYIGLFQMGSHERATYGDARDVLGEIQAAYRYFIASGSDWSPWSCKP